MCTTLGAFVTSLLFHLVRVMSEAAEEVFYKKMFLKISQYSGLQACNFIKKGLLLISCGHCKIFKNTYFEEHLRTVLL